MEQNKDGVNCRSRCNRVLWRVRHALWKWLFLAATTCALVLECHVECGAAAARRALPLCVGEQPRAPSPGAPPAHPPFIFACGVPPIQHPHPRAPSPPLPSLLAPRLCPTLRHARLLLRRSACDDKVQRRRPVPMGKMEV